MPGKYTILVVEDNNLLRELLKRFLSESYHVLPAADGEAALTILRHYASTLDLLLADISLPDMNGWDLIRQSRDLRPGMKFLIMSGDRNRLFSGRPEDVTPPCLLKPFPLSELQFLLERTLEPAPGEPREAGCPMSRGFRDMGNI